MNKNNAHYSFHIEGRIQSRLKVPEMNKYLWVVDKFNFI